MQVADIMALMTGPTYVCDPMEGSLQVSVGAFFVSAGVLFYLYLVKVSVPIGSILVPPRVHGVRAIVHSTLFAISFYFGFLRK